MARPLIICDCDEVLMHMVVPFGDWLAADHGIRFQLENTNFGGALTRIDNGEVVPPMEVWPLLDGFFAREMHRQYAVAGAAAALTDLAGHADIVILTNVGDGHQPARRQQIIAAGMDYPVVGNRGPKGPPLADLVAQYAPTLTIFVDDLPQHHASVAEHAPDAWRLHMVAEPAIADKIPTARHAHARIDDWAEAHLWINQILAQAQGAPIIAKEPHI